VITCVSVGLYWDFYVSNGKIASLVCFSERVDGYDRICVFFAKFDVGGGKLTI